MTYGINTNYKEDDRFQQITLTPDIVERAQTKEGIDGVSEELYEAFRKGDTLILVLKSDTTQEHILLNFYQS